jgi:hypothetical protein
MTKPKSAAEKAAAKSARKSSPKKSSPKVKAASEPKRAAAPKLSFDRDRAPQDAQVIALVRRLKVSQKEASEAAGKMGEMIAKACETQHFDRKALSIVRGLDSMSPRKLSTTLPHLLMYIDALELGKRAAEQGQLIPDPVVAKAQAKANSKKKKPGEDDDGEADAGSGSMDEDNPAAGSLQTMESDQDEDRQPLH